MLNSKGEIADFVDVSQFIPGRSAYECVAYSAALIYYAGLPGHGPTGTALQASNLAQYWYGREEGSNLASNTNGMSLDALYNMLQGMGLTYQPLDADISTIHNAFEFGGVPIMLCGAETGMYDLGLGDRVPYAWTPTGNHCIVISGVRSDGNLLVHDCANVSSAGVRPGPRVYDASKLQIVSATAVHLRGDFMIPQGWRDDGTVLYSPSHIQGGPEIPVTGPFRDYVLANAWRPTDRFIEVGHHVDKLEYSNESLGSGWRQQSLYSILEKPDSGLLAGKVLYGWQGVESLYLRNAYEAAQSEIAQLKAQPAGLDAGKVTDRLTAISLLLQQATQLTTQAIV